MKTAAFGPADGFDVDLRKYHAVKLLSNTRYRTTVEYNTQLMWLHMDHLVHRADDEVNDIQA